jgi:hypothetical protein
MSWQAYNLTAQRESHVMKSFGEEARLNSAALKVIAVVIMAFFASNVPVLSSSLALTSITRKESKPYSA